MKQINRIIVMVAVLFGSASAHAGWGILGGLNFFNFKDSGVDTSSAFMAGLAFEGRMGPGLGIEADGLYVKNKQSGTSDASSIQVPVIVRLHLLPLFSIGAGGYANFFLDDLVNMKKTDFGALGSVRLSLPAGAFSVILEGRYLLGLTNVAEVGDAKTRAVQALAGITFGI